MKRIYDLDPKLSSEITDQWELEIDISGEIESDKITISELMKFTLATINQDRFQLSAGFVTSKEMRFSDLTTFVSIDNVVDEITSLTYETRNAGQTVYTTRADLAALNTFSQSTSDFYFKVSATFDVTYFGQSDVTVKSSIYTP